MLSVLREAAEKEGYEVRGFVPGTRAAQQPGESGIENRNDPEVFAPTTAAGQHHPLFVLDESSLANTKHIHKLFARLESKIRCF